MSVPVLSKHPLDRQDGTAHPRRRSLMASTQLCQPGDSASDGSRSRDPSLDSCHRVRRHALLLQNDTRKGIGKRKFPSSDTFARS
jgi:hypothetical protein